MTTTLLSVMASKFPGNLGRMQVKDAYMDWVERAHGPVPYSGQLIRGRASLGVEIQQTAQLRDVGRFLQEHVVPSATILTPWPGSIRYVSRMQVLDLFGRVTSPAGETLEPFWPARPRVDLVKAIEQRPDFILADLVDLRNTEEGPMRLGMKELLQMDIFPEDSMRIGKIEAILGQYEMVALPILPERDLRMGRPRPFPILRRKDLGMSPLLRLEIEGDQLRAISEFSVSDEENGMESHPQLVGLEIKVLDAQGKVWRLSPSGGLHANPLLYARTELRLQSGDHPETLLGSWTLPSSPNGSRLVRISAGLYNPILDKQHPFARACRETSVRL